VNVERISRKRSLQAAAAGGSALLVPSWVRAAGLPPNANPRDDSVVVLWNEALVQGVRESKLGPPMVSRALAIAHTCGYDAWSAYDRAAVGTRLGGTLREPPAARTLANKNGRSASRCTTRQAISFPTAGRVSTICSSSSGTTHRTRRVPQGSD
jgi:hypothetical protein